jgi:hypothetical protein
MRSCKPSTVKPSPPPSLHIFPASHVPMCRALLLVACVKWRFLLMQSWQHLLASYLRRGGTCDPANSLHHILTSPPPPPTPLVPLLVIWLHRCANRMLGTPGTMQPPYVAFLLGVLTHTFCQARSAVVGCPCRAACVMWPFVPSRRVSL